MREFKDSIHGKRLLCSIDKIPELKYKLIITPILEMHTGNVYYGSFHRRGYVKIGKFYKINGQHHAAIESTIWYK